MCLSVRRTRVDAPRTRVLLLATVILAGAASFAPRPALAQFTDCPFAPDAAVADTLDPSGYYPLALGNAWEYVRWSGCCLDRVTRRQVVGDTLVAGNAYRIIHESSVYYRDNYGDPLDTGTISRREERREYLMLSEGVLQSRSQEQEFGVGRDLSRPFQSCHVDDVTGTQTVVWALTEAPYTLEKYADAGDSTPVGKGLDVEGKQILYQHGVGYVSGGRGDTLEVLTYASIDRLSFGDPLLEVFGALVSREPEDLLPGEFRLVNYPNPFSASTHLAFTLPEEGSVTVHVIDVLGRRVAVPLDGARLSAGSHDVEWRADRLASGMYFVQLIHDDRVVASRSVILAR